MLTPPEFFESVRQQAARDPWLELAFPTGPSPVNARRTPDKFEDEFG
ncbi:hypothetical protein [Streptomyces sp. NPDC059786]